MRKIIIGLGAAMLLVLTGCASGEKRIAGEDSPATTTTLETEDTFPDEGVTSSTKPKIDRHHEVGYTGTLFDVDTNKELLRVQVEKVKFSSGDEFNKPERGNFMGAYVRVKALADDQNSLWGDFYVLMRGHHYDADACCVDAWKPELDYVDLNEGETAEGWLTFDVPAKHGQVVLGQSFGGGMIATWSF